MILYEKLSLQTCTRSSFIRSPDLGFGGDVMPEVVDEFHFPTRQRKTTYKDEKQVKISHLGDTLSVEAK